MVVRGMRLGQGAVCRSETMRATKPPLLKAVRRPVRVGRANRDHCARDGQRSCRGRAGAAAGIGPHRRPCGSHPAALPRSAGRLEAVRFRRVPAVLLSRSADHQLRQRRRADGLAASRRARRHHLGDRVLQGHRDLEGTVHRQPGGSRVGWGRFHQLRGGRQAAAVRRLRPARLRSPRLRQQRERPLLHHRGETRPIGGRGRSAAPGTRRPMPPSWRARSSTAKRAPAPSSAGS